jgi:hypothetical protein
MTRNLSKWLRIKKTYNPLRKDTNTVLMNQLIFDAHQNPHIRPKTKRVMFAKSYQKINRIIAMW